VIWLAKWRKVKVVIEVVKTVSDCVVGGQRPNLNSSDENIISSLKSK
jgi:hypothetical protein